jgi:hypothetical protein
LSDSAFERIRVEVASVIGRGRVSFNFSSSNSTATSGAGLPFRAKLSQHPFRFRRYIHNHPHIFKMRQREMRYRSHRSFSSGAPHAAEKHWEIFDQASRARAPRREEEGNYRGREGSR